MVQTNGIRVEMVLAEPQTAQFFQIQLCIEGTWGPKLRKQEILTWIMEELQPQHSYLIRKLVSYKWDESNNSYRDARIGIGKLKCFDRRFYKILDNSAY